MFPTNGQQAEGPEPFAVNTLLKHKTRVIWVAALGVALVLGWFCYRSVSDDLYYLTVILAAATYGVLKVAVEIVVLVVQTLVSQ